MWRHPVRYTYFIRCVNAVFVILDDYIAGGGQSLDVFQDGGRLGWCGSPLMQIGGDAACSGYGHEGADGKSFHKRFGLRIGVS